MLKVANLPWSIKKPSWHFAPSKLEKAAAWRQLAVMLKSGVPLVKALCILESGGPNFSLARVWGEACQEVLKGGHLSEGMFVSGHVFSLTEVGMIRAGEAAADLPGSCNFLADLLEQEYALQRSFSAALQYPLFLFAFSILIMTILLQHVMTTFFQAFLQEAASLPWLTLCLMRFSMIFSRPAWCLAFLIIASLVIGLAVNHYRTALGKYRWQFAVLQLPVIGQAVRNMIVARFSRTLALMIKSGLPLLSALELAGYSPAFYPLSQATDIILGEVREGNTICEAFAQSCFFPPLFLQMVFVAEEANSISYSLEKAAEIYHQQAAQALERLKTVLEPLLTAVTGIFIAIVLVGLFLPLCRFAGELM